MSVADQQLDKTDRSETMGDRVYQELRHAVMVGRFKPDQKIKIRTLATGLGTSLTPVREALTRLVAEGAFVGEPNKSVRMPPLTVQRVRELQELRIVIEGYAARKATENINAISIRKLRQIHLEILVARDNNDIQLDIEKIRQFHFTLYAASMMPSLLSIIESLFLQTGPWLNLLFPEFVKGRRGENRLRMLQALESRDADAVEKEIHDDLRISFDFIAEHAAAMES